MNAAIGELLPLALGVAISPIPVIATIVLLLTPHAKRSGGAFAVGWLAGCVGTILLFAALAGTLPRLDGASWIPIVGWVQVVLGIALIVFAIRIWRHRPRAEGAAQLPGWMQHLDRMSVITTVGLGLVLSSINPKNLLIGISAGIALGTSSLTASEAALAVGVYAVISSSTVVAPVLAYFFASRRLAGTMRSLKEWLARENSTIMAVLLLIIGASVLGKGMTSV